MYIDKPEYRVLHHRRNVRQPYLTSRKRHHALRLGGLIPAYATEDMQQGQVFEGSLTVFNPF
jgi:hypothetical protein